MEEKRIDNVTDFVSVLIDELFKKSFKSVDVCNGYSEREESYLFTITAGKRRKKYTLSFYAKEKSLNYKTIEKIVDWFLRK